MAGNYLTMNIPTNNAPFALASYYARMNSFAQQVNQLGLLSTLESYTTSFLITHASNSLYQSAAQGLQSILKRIKVNPTPKNLLPKLSLTDINLKDYLTFKNGKLGYNTYLGTDAQGTEHYKFEEWEVIQGQATYELIESQVLVDPQSSTKLWNKSDYRVVEDTIKDTKGQEHSIRIESNSKMIKEYLNGELIGYQVVPHVVSPQKIFEYCHILTIYQDPEDLLQIPSHMWGYEECSKAMLLSAIETGVLHWSGGKISLFPEEQERLRNFTNFHGARLDQEIELTKQARINKILHFQETGQATKLDGAFLFTSSDDPISVLTKYADGLSYTNHTAGLKEIEGKLYVIELNRNGLSKTPILFSEYAKTCKDLSIGIPKDSEAAQKAAEYLLTEHYTKDSVSKQYKLDPAKRQVRYSYRSLLPG